MVVPILNKILSIKLYLDMLLETIKMCLRLFDQVAPSCERMFLYCKWKGKRVDCKHYVRQMKTDTGFCCSINAINLAENYLVPEDNKDSVNTNYNGCPYYSSDSYYSTTPSYSYYGTSKPPCKNQI